MQHGNLIITAPALNASEHSEAEIFGSAVWLWMNAKSQHDMPLHALSLWLLSATKTVNLSATQNVDILASADTESNRSTNSASSTSVGLSVGIGSGGAGLSLDIAASRGKGQANSDSTTYNNSHVSAGNAVNITSGADTNVVGGNIKANQVTANVGGNLNVESLQDKAVSEASQKTTGIALSIPITGAGGSASFSQSKQNSNSNYASVNEQSGIQAGDGGQRIDSRARARRRRWKVRRQIRIQVLNRYLLRLR